MAHETTSELRVRYAETDQMGVVYHANYLVWCEIGRTDFIRMMGKSYAELERDGVTLAVSDATVRFHASARYDDPVRVHTTLASLRSRAMTFAYRIVRADTNQLLASASTTLVSLGRDGRMITMPDELKRMLSSVVTAPSATP